MMNLTLSKEFSPTWSSLLCGLASSVSRLSLLNSPVKCLRSVMKVLAGNNGSSPSVSAQLSFLSTSLSSSYLTALPPLLVETESLIRENSMLEEVSNPSLLMHEANYLNEPTELLKFEIKAITLGKMFTLSS